MNLHEYQGKSILKSYGVAVQEGIVVDKVEDAVAAAKKLSEETGTSWFVVKAQIHAGGRGKGTVEETGSHGVVIAKGLDQVEEKVAGILGGHLTTLQTNGVGKKVNKVLIAQDVYYPGASEPEEFYMSVLLDREKGRNVIIYSTEGGMDIEFLTTESLPYHPNGLSFLAAMENGEHLAQTYYSVGGGFIEQENQQPETSSQTELPFPVNTAKDLLHWCMKTGMSVSEIVLENESSWRTEAETKEGILNIWSVMKQSIYMGCNTEGILSGGLQVRRRAKDLNHRLIGAMPYKNHQEW